MVFYHISLSTDSISLAKRDVSDHNLEGVKLKHKCTRMLSLGRLTAGDAAEVKQPWSL